MMVKWPALPKSSYAVSNFLRCTTTFFSGGPKKNNAQQRKISWTSNGRKISRISFIFKLLSFHATGFGPVWFVNISESPPCTLPQGFRTNPTVKLRFKRGNMSRGPAGREIPKSRAYKH